ncbi:MAG: Na+/H+ antiporter NhaC [Chitinophagales bacterium]
MNQSQTVTFGQAIIPILFFVCLLIFGLFVQPVVLKGGILPLEVLILLAFTFSSLYLLRLGYAWETIQKHIVKKVGESVGVILILFAIGMLIGSWIVSGTIPMLIYYGISIINPNWIYIFTFLVCIIFSLLTGTSWGSAGTIGIVMMGISEVYEANLCIAAAAVVGGSFFGDKMSPLSDTTNIASLATGVPLFDHIKSMAYTTAPSAFIAGLIYIALSPAMYGSQADISVRPEQLENTLQALSQIFHFNTALLLPLVLVVWGSVTKKPIVLTLLCSAWLAMVLAFVFQDFSLQDIWASFNNGFSTQMAKDIEVDASVLGILNRGGLYNLIQGITSCFLIFAFIGTLDVINAIEVVIKNGMSKIQSRSQTIVAALTSTALTNLTTSNQYATSFIIGEAFKRKFDEMKVPRKVLSRSIEDAGTMLENLAPWTPSGIFMATTLGVSAVEYAPYQFLSLINIAVAYFFAVTGIACFYESKNKNIEKDI